jgi:hypothetical protein
MMDRRKFVQACTVLLGSSVLAAGCGGSGGGGDPADVSIDNVSLPDLSKSRWVNLPATNFFVTHSTYGAIDMELTAIDDDILIPEAEQFSVTLRGPELPLLEEDVYQVYNDTFGYFELFLQPATSAPGEQNYRAVFSILQV